MTTDEMRVFVDAIVDDTSMPDDDRIEAIHVRLLLMVAEELESFNARLKQSHLGISP